MSAASFVPAAVRVFLCIAVSCGLQVSLPCEAAAPTMYRQPAHQSPVRAQPDDLLLLAGYGFSSRDQVVYRAVADTTQPQAPPDRPPGASDANLGVAPVVSTANVPHSLTIRLPTVLRSGQAYALWVRNEQQEWSEAVQINDARPHWLTPAFVYASAAVASLPRAVKIVGRNLEPAPGATTEVMLVGPETVRLVAERAAPEVAALEHYVARVQLPARMSVGQYRVQVRRDGISWVELRGSTLEVRPDPGVRPQFQVGDAAFGGCHPDDDQDDTRCVLRSIAAAQEAGGGTVVFSKGAWHFLAPDRLGVNGIVLPQGVSLRGAGARETSLIRSAAWSASSARATFTLSGHNTVQGLRFGDARAYHRGDRSGPSLKLGAASGERAARSLEPEEIVREVIITENIFDRPFTAIGDSGSPLARLFITGNEFGAFAAALSLSGNRFNVNQPFRVDDAVIAHNVFKPGSYLDGAARQGTIASEIGAGRRVDFSNNVADGAATEYLDSPGDARGWRAAFFWHMNGNQEQVLVSQNLATCTGDKVGDGEAIAYDNNGNTFAFDSARHVLAATADSVTVDGALRQQQNNRRVAPESYYVGHWIQVGEGPGVGQVRRIESYRIEPESGRVTFAVAPGWDVVPAPQVTRISVGREFWQVYTVANTVDHRQPRCLKSNRSDRRGGVIVLWAQAADSAIEANRQFDSDGILLQQLYSAQDAACRDCDRGTHFLSFVEVRGNTIDGEYDWSDDCSSSGIFGSLAASPTPRSPPLTVSYGLSISHNTIVRADGKRGGAIAFRPSWYQGPAPHRWPLVNNALIHHNALLGLDAAPARACGSESAQPRTGISLGGSSLVWRTVLYANSCADAPRRVNLGEAATRVCVDRAPLSCECAS